MKLLAIALVGALSAIFWIPRFPQPLQYDHGRLCTTPQMPSPCAPVHGRTASASRADQQELSRP